MAGTWTHGPAFVRRGIGLRDEARRCERKNAQCVLVLWKAAHAREKNEMPDADHDLQYAESLRCPA